MLRRNFIGVDQRIFRNERLVGFVQVNPEVVTVLDCIAANHLTTVFRDGSVLADSSRIKEPSVVSGIQADSAANQL